MATATTPATRPTQAPLSRPALIPATIVALLALLAATSLAVGNNLSIGADTPITPLGTPAPAAAPATTPPLAAGTILESKGKLEGVASHRPRRVTATGWAIGGVVGEPLVVEFNSAGQVLSTVSPNTPRPEIGQQHPGTGLDHGFNHTFAMVPGRHLICATAVTSAGDQLDLGCSVATVVR